MAFLDGIRFNHQSDGVSLSKASGGGVFTPPEDVCISRIDKDGNLMGGVIFTNYTGPGGSICMHVASFDPRWINRDMLFVCFDYPFNQLEVKKIFGQTPEFNAEALKFNLNAGFKPEHRVKDAYPEGDMILLGMYRADCRFLRLAPRRLKGVLTDG